MQDLSSFALRQRRMLHAVQVGCQGVRVKKRRVEPVVATVERGPVFSPEQLNHLDRFVQPFQPLLGRVEGDAERLVLEGVPRPTDGELQPPAQNVVDRCRHLGPDDRRAVSIASHQNAEANAVPKPVAMWSMRQRLSNRNKQPKTEEGRRFLYESIRTSVRR